jgi:NAD(P)H-hydrate repair Nnr-like enzyme with NAD(P)H-hydrate dehydratase domain
LVLTPHAGELQRLADALGAAEEPRPTETPHPADAGESHPADADAADARQPRPTNSTVLNSRRVAEALGAVVVAKGPTTYIVASGRDYLSSSGTPALAKAGTGDVLSGIIGSLMAQGAAPFDAAVLGVELHSRAGCLAEQELSRRGVCAQDLPVRIPSILKTIEGH